MITPQVITATLIAGTATAYYTAPTTIKKAQLKSITITNSEVATAYTVTIYLVPSAGTAAIANMLVNARSIAAGETLHITEAENKVLAAGGMLQALASTASKINIQGTVLEFT